ncbi:coiled-coil domain-containing protein 158 isoform X2 [Archocentrus centrarchus]|uniref:coiled-coil domain-containing protein 158 isoform X2 n=1 Tax=Archocentrus centrarchus TaxID=63155 RepID=UPI0011E9BB17|nr:coiled-coil domain-containing protein 158 isoform X2 [Archocentrus centrarchus]
MSSSGFHPSKPQSFRPSISSDVVQSRSPANDRTAAGTADPHGSPLLLRFNSLTLDELSEELDRRTKETQRLQEEVENATKVVLERFGCSCSIMNSPGQTPRDIKSHAYDSLRESSVLSTHQQAVTQPLVFGLDILNQEVTRRDISSPGKETPNQAEQEPCCPQNAIANLQTELHKVQLQNGVLSDLRLKDSRKHVDQMEKMLCLLEELQKLKRSRDKTLQEMEDEAMALNRKVETLEQTIKEMYHTLQEKQCEHSVTSTKCKNSRTQQLLPAEATVDLNDKLQGRPSLSEEQMESEEHSGANEQERVVDLITSLSQEVAMLTDKLSSSKDHGVGLCAKVELLKKLAERQSSLRQHQAREIESTLSSLKDKVCSLEQQRTEAQREKEQSLTQAMELHSQLEQLQRCCEQQQFELQEGLKVLRGQFEVTKEQLHRAGEEKIYLEALLEQRDQEGRKSQELLREKHNELQLRQQETHQHLTRLKEAQSQCQTLQTERETLRLKLNDSERTINVLRFQMESSMQVTVQHSHTIDGLQQENSLLSNQLNQHKLEMQQLRAELQHHKSRLTAVEHERRQLEATVAEQSQRIRDETLEKQQLTAQLELQCMQLVSVTKEHKELQQLHSCKEAEHEGVVLHLQSQIRKAHDELDQIRSTLRTLKGADGHGLQVALDMQKEITARREQVDSMQSRIQHLDDKVEKLCQEKHYQNLETQRQLQELTFVREEKRQLANELEVLHSKDQQLRDRISELEAILHKMSESFANCQDFIQLREQEYFCLKLQHALDLKELQGQNLHTALKGSPPDLDSLIPSSHTAPPSSQHASNTQLKLGRQLESPAGESFSLVKELRGVILENPGPHTDHSTTGSSFHRRRSAPERLRRTTVRTDNAEEVNSGSKPRRTTCSSKLCFLKTAEPDGKIMKSCSQSHLISRPQTAVRYTSSPPLLSLGRRSPVHSLLTSDPNN